MYEELLIGSDNSPTDHPRIMRSHEAFVPWPELGGGLERLLAALERGDAREVKAIIHKLVPEFVSETGLVDWVAQVQSDQRGVAAE